MATTPEGRVKNKIKKVLDKYNTRLYVYMPVPSGYGAPSLDFVCSVAVGNGAGLTFAIEAKRPGQVPSPRQEGTIAAMGIGGVRVFVIDGDLGCEALETWLHHVTGGN